MGPRRAIGNSTGGTGSAPRYIRRRPQSCWREDAVSVDATVAMHAMFESNGRADADTVLALFY
jgi:hypothetical protein